MHLREHRLLGFTPREIEYICSVYDSRSETIDVLQERWPNRPRWHFRSVGQKFGLAKPKPPRWTEQGETFLITERHRFSPKQMAQKLGRSENAVKLKLKRLGYKWIQGINGFLTMRAVSRIFGVDAKTVSWWIDSGWLKGSRFPVGMGPYRARKIAHEAIYDFIEDDRYWHLWQPVRMKPGDFREWAEESRDGKGQFLTSGQLGKLTFYTHSWIRHLIVRGIIKARKHGPNWKIPEEEADKFIREYYHSLRDLLR